MIFAFTVPGDPVGKGRARGTRSGRHYTPARTRAYEALVKHIGMAARPRGWPLDADYRLILGVYVRDRRVSRPDGSNVQKAVEDALNGVAWRDDRQIRAWSGELKISRDNPRVEVTVEIL